MNASPRSRDKDWAIVLAAGEGQRLARVTRALYGRDMPKQFAALEGEQTMLQQTMVRAARSTPEERTVVVVGDDQAPLAREQLAMCPRSHLVQQPRNVGTLPGLLLPLAHILHETSHPMVVVYPADHHVSKLGPFVDAVSDALAAVEHAPARTVLVGASADRPATDLGWILAGRTLDADEGGRVGAGVGLRAVESFVEKPPAPTAARLLAGGALWNTLIIAMDGTTFWEAALTARPELAWPFERYRSSIGTAREGEVLHEVYERLPNVDLSRDFLARRSGLGVVELADSGWSDCGTPERLFESLAHCGNLQQLLGRLGGWDARPRFMERGAD
jgi:mannose-1-phosphate guanylyltransferase